jgi:hypothetical protein
MQLRTHSLPLKGFGSSATEATVQTAVLSPADRLKRAGTILLIGIAVAAGALPIPIIHLFLPPIALLLGLVLGANRLRHSEVFRSARGRCPFCGTQQSFSVMGRFELPKSVNCSNCHRRLELQG